MFIILSVSHLITCEIRLNEVIFRVPFIFNFSWLNILDSPGYSQEDLWFICVLWVYDLLSASPLHTPEKVKLLFKITQNLKSNLAYIILSLHSFTYLKTKCYICQKDKPKIYSWTVSCMSILLNCDRGFWWEDKVLVLTDAYTFKGISMYKSHN